MKWFNSKSGSYFEYVRCEKRIRRMDMKMKMRKQHGVINYNSFTLTFVFQFFQPTSLTSCPVPSRYFPIWNFWSFYFISNFFMIINFDCTDCQCISEWASLHLLQYTSPWIQGVNWTYISRSEDVLDVFWTSYVR